MKIESKIKGRWLIESRNKACCYLSMLLVVMAGLGL